MVRDLKHPAKVLYTPILTEISNEDKKDPIMVMIQTENIKQYVLNINTTTKHNQALRVNLGTVLSITTDQIVSISKIYQTFTNIKLSLDFHQAQHFYIWYQPHSKWILFCSYGHENHIQPKTRNRQA